MEKSESQVDTSDRLSIARGKSDTKADLPKHDAQKTDFDCPVYVPNDHKTIGDFLILREIGRGGMGVVYEAIQRSLSRRVALKVLAAGISDSPQQLERFRREAESAAMLHHTNIVGVFGIGEENGVHFYAMQYIDGIPLGDAIATMRHRSTISSSRRNGRSNSTNSEFDHRPHSVSPSEQRRALNVDAPTVLMEIELDSDFNNSVWNSDADFSALPSNPITPIIDQTSDHAPSAPEQGTSPVEPAAIPRSSPESVNSCFGNFQNNSSNEYFLRVANLAIQVADALEYAHQQGVLHRDIKPSNLMIDRKGTVWIMDFGLVKLIEKKDLTKVGEIVGTLRYMAPEQLEGKADVTTDIYALGITLFELLTLRPAFDADEAGTLAQRLRQSDIPRPRSLNSSIPRDLETIILKATAREPFLRYQSAGMMADDLRRYCADMPILARRTTYPERLWRWSRRNPALAIASGSIVLLLGIIAAVASIGYWSVNEAFSEAEVARRRAESNLDLAIDAFESILENVTSREGPQTLSADDDSDRSREQSLSASSDDDVRLLNGLLGFYRRFTSQNADNNLLRERTSFAHRRAAAILVRLGRLAEAEEDYSAAIVSLFRVMKSEPENSSVVITSASIQNDLGEVTIRRGEIRQTFIAHLEAIALLSKLPVSLQVLPLVQFEMARAHAMLASIDLRSGADVSGEMTPLPERLSLRLIAAVPSEYLPGRSIKEGAIRALRESSEQFRTLSVTFRADAEYQYRLAQSLRLRANLAWVDHDSESARLLFHDAMDVLQKLKAEHSREPKYLLEQAETLVDFSTIEGGKRAMEMLDTAESDANRLAKLFPVASDYLLLVNVALTKRAAIEAETGSVSKSLETLQRSIDGFKKLARRFSDQGVIQIPFALARRQMAILLMENSAGEDSQRKLVRSREQLEAAIKQFESYLGKLRTDSALPQQHDFNLRTRSMLYSSLADSLQKLNLTEEANQARKKAEEVISSR